MESQTRKPAVDINVLTWNAERYLRACLDSALKQTYSACAVNVLDNGSQDRTVEIIKKDYSGRGIKLLAKEQNIGFAAGHNYLLRATRGEYVVFLNQDALLTPSFVERAVEVMEKHPRLAALQPKLLRYDFRHDRPQKTIDSTGLKILRNRRIINRGQGEHDRGQYADGEIFGADGALPVYRRSALEDVKISRPVSLTALEADLPGSVHGVARRDFQPALSAEENQRYEYLDEDFFAYKEDVDLAWRFQLYGWQARYLSAVVGYHERGAGESAARKWRAIIRERRRISLPAKQLSWRNQRLMQVKNERPRLFWRDFWPILKKELLAGGYVLFFEPRVLKALPELLRLLPTAWEKRAVIMANRRASDQALGRWFKS